MPVGTRVEGAETNNLVSAARVSTSMNNRLFGDLALRGAAARVSNATGDMFDEVTNPMAPSNHNYTIIDSLMVDAGRNASKTTVGAAEGVHYGGNAPNTTVEDVHYDHDARCDVAGRSFAQVLGNSSNLEFVAQN
ncbi:hypothetical protein TorRG33x02_338930 [Trema orientale]|uniref:Uncharacterized protein n=1 Tax=Trema orientale TaxID=63057 RepID=A0A2P5AX06_TREOI|nr:hypothetical protein TorRG33x02_338930 [Trema orientale]